MKSSTNQLIINAIFAFRYFFEYFNEWRIENRVRKNKLNKYKKVTIDFNAVYQCYVI